MGRDLTDGFSQYYRADPARERAAFESGLIVLDANVLLNVLRYSPSARDELLTVIEEIAGRCFVPHQIAREYNRNRVRVVAGRHKELTDAAAEIESIRGSVRTLVSRLRDRRILPSDQVLKLEESVSTFVSALEEASSDAAEQYDLDPASLVGRLDEWTDRLNRALQGKVAEPPTQQVLEEDEREAKRRRENKIAPGFKDDAGGDYLWWAEVLRCPQIKGRPLLVVSDDVAKGDWLFEEHGITIGPTAILIDDALSSGALDLTVLTTRDLLKLAEDIGGSKVSESTIAESEKILTTRRVPWTLEGYVELIEALDNEGYESRVKVIRAAARNDGRLLREDVYSIVGIREADRSLRQFVTPVLRLTGYLEHAGVVPEGVPDALAADYHDGPGKASGYSVPPEFVDFEREMGSLEEIVKREATTDWRDRDQVQAQMRSYIKREAQALTSPEAASRVAEIVVSRAQAQTTESQRADQGQ